MLVSGCSSRFVSDQPGGEEARVAVVRVTDGGTVKIPREIDGENRVRFIGVDTPETDSERGQEPYGEEAARFTQRSLEDQNVIREFDVERKDDYGRLLAYAYLPDDSMFNETLLREGYAQIATFPPTRGTSTASRRRRGRPAKPGGASGAYRRASSAGCGTAGTASAVVREEKTARSSFSVALDFRGCSRPLTHG